MPFQPPSFLPAGLILAAACAGLLLTAAHVVAERAFVPARPLAVAIPFGAGIRSGEGRLKVPATRVILHPEYGTPSGQMAKGDSGGPLLLNTKGDVKKVAGVYHGAYHEPMVSLRTGKTVPVFQQYFVPVPDHLEWIRSVLAGNLGKSKVFALGKAAVGCGTEAGAEGQTKAEPKAEAGEAAAEAEIPAGADGEETGTAS
jgi:hypothetical protein